MSGFKPGCETPASTEYDYNDKAGLGDATTKSAEEPSLPDAISHRLMPSDSGSDSGHDMVSTVHSHARQSEYLVCSQTHHWGTTVTIAYTSHKWSCCRCCMYRGVGSQPLRRHPVALLHKTACCTCFSKLAATRETQQWYKSACARFTSATSILAAWARRRRIDGPSRVSLRLLLHTLVRRERFQSVSCT
jgi:hypothetical protein